MSATADDVTRLSGELRVVKAERDALERERDAYKLRAQALEALCAFLPDSAPSVSKDLEAAGKAAIDALAGGEGE